ncbi:hypothetical protein D7319_31945 [Streptomyces radicis]|uniref:XdhC Rossmann domain-containing protein n=1 Tax=Streptomyces radicis TaxID=1750517 RepID=A0A3A9WB97_9ACTN|nr:hypothetical protein D7319_31945 [Streptomyces radicis]RKN13120.1 hypothetical protein D7318_31880 [Streptomyces radicis]
MTRRRGDTTASPSTSDGGAVPLARLASPIGLDLGARTPEETAVAIMAEIIAQQWGSTGRRLTDTTPLPIHH